MRDFDIIEEFHAPVVELVDTRYLEVVVAI